MSRIVAGVVMAVVLSGPALAQSSQSMVGTVPGYEPSALELALPELEARLQAFAEEAEAIDDDETLTDAQRDARLTALWVEYGPDVAALGSAAAGFGVSLAGTMIEAMDIDAIVHTALAQVEGLDIEGEVADAMAQVEIAAALADAQYEMRDLDTPH